MDIEPIIVNNMYFCLPGETLPVKASPSRYIKPYEDGIRFKQAGILEPQRLYNISSQYFPSLEDHIIGQIKQKTSDFYLVDIGSGMEAILGLTDFEGATKKNKPNLAENSLIYCKINENNKFLRTKITCIHGKIKKDWASGESVFGELKNGLIFQVTISFAKNLLTNSNQQNILKKFQSFISFEIAIGVNGYIWISCKSSKNIQKSMVILKNCIQQCQDIKDQQLDEAFKQFQSIFKSIENN